MTDIDTTNDDCLNCSLANLCFPSAFNEKELFRFSNIANTNITYKANSDLYQQGNNVQYLYVIKSGSFKTHSSTVSGSQHTHDFLLPGELPGLEGLADRVALNTATAIEDSVVCRINYPQLIALRQELPRLSDYSVRMYGEALALSQSMLGCISKPSAASRLACFILIMLNRTTRVKPDSNELYLNMSRKDIACYLGLAVETVSRSFSKLVSWGYISKSKRKIQILDAEGLQLCATNTEF